MTPLVLVHGFMGGAEQWTAQRASLSREFRVFTPDLPGFAGNAAHAPLASIGEFADWVLADLARRDVPRFHLLGHSMGGMIAQEMARCAPERIAKLVLYGTGATGLLPGRFEPIAESKRRAVRDGAVATARRIAATWFRDDVTATAYPACAAIAEQASPEAILAGLDAMAGWDGTAHLREIAADTLILWGDRDRTYPWEQIECLWRQIPRTQLAVVPNAAHAVHLERPSLFNDVVLGFL